MIAVVGFVVRSGQIGCGLVFATGCFIEFIYKSEAAVVLGGCVFGVPTAELVCDDVA